MELGEISAEIIVQRANAQRGGMSGSRSIGFRSVLFSFQIHPISAAASRICETAMETSTDATDKERARKIQILDGRSKTEGS